MSIEYPEIPQALPLDDKPVLPRRINLPSIDPALEERVCGQIRSHLLYEPTPGQSAFIRSFGRFAADPEPGIFLLRGYAGTGKTTMMAALTGSFRNIVLLAPTGRAAKVLSLHTGRPAFTIHKHLYRPVPTSDGRTMLVVTDNPFQRCLFIVDEASMIPDAAIEDTDSPFPGVNLLSDLVRYVFSGMGCRLMLVGDTAQLPPVHFENSPALDADHLRHRFGKKVYRAELTDVVRQQAQSAILVNATRLRDQILRENDHSFPAITEAPDVKRIPVNELPECLEQAYREHGRENVIVVTRSNRSANQYNRMIRFQTLWMEDEIGGGDRLMVVRNNYFWLPKDHAAGFIANGDMLEVHKIVRFEERFGFRFAMASFSYSDLPDEPAFEAMILLDTLTGETPAMTKQDRDRLLKALHVAYEEEEPDRRRRSGLIKKDPYFQALQVKFAYAITCHKAQGGQWPVVFVDQGYLTEEMLGREFYRWLYTALTRSSAQLFLLNFNDRFFPI